MDEDDTESKVPAAAITNNVVEAKTKSDSEIESERNTTTSGKESETETETETETDTDSEVKGANKDDKMIRTTRKSRKLGLVVVVFMLELMVVTV